MGNRVLAVVFAAAFMLPQAARAQEVISYSGSSTIGMSIL